MRVDRRQIVAWLERALLLVGIGCLGYYAYKTVEARKFQQEQSSAFVRTALPADSDGRVVPTSAADAATVGKPVAGVAPVAAVPHAPLAPGTLALLEIPRLKISSVVISGDSDAVLDVAVGHLSDTPAPWEPVNSVLAAHRDGLFRPLKNIRIGDEVRVRSAHGDFAYRVRETRIVNRDDLSVLNPTPKPTLTLITCYPFNYVGSAPRRFIVHADRVEQSGTKNEELRTKNGTKNGIQNEELGTKKETNGQLRAEQRAERTPQAKRATNAASKKPATSRSKVAKASQSKVPPTLTKTSTAGKSTVKPASQETESALKAETQEPKKRPRFLRWLLGS